MTERGSAVDLALELRDVVAGYGETQVLHGIDLHLRQGEIVSLLGRNGAGKSTTLKVIAGLLRNRKGSIRIDGKEAIGLPARQTARLGLAYCPEDRGIFSSLTVHENLLLPPVLKPGGLTVEELYTTFPNLWARRDSGGTKLSGGEQQMLAIARILRSGAKILLLDEPTEGLAPVIVEEIGSLIRTLRDRGYTILLVEQNYRFARAFADRHYIMETGRVADEIVTADMPAREHDIRAYLGL
ncbi:ABC transporter ATP-binding protein [Arvimicrobium flavum]|uniref:ABC transporter ATP-binding protein n=1 Tax=Arvimicrobium flavum TaxID=3393320 RepID=UPI00237A10CA|nr:ABC transporter ATP-binding protein [Mesorhizobium shangrilense]